VGTTDFNTRDLDSDKFFKQFTALEEAVPSHGSTSNLPFEQMLQFGPGRFDVVGTTEAEAAPLLAKAQRGDDLELRYPQTPFVADVVLAPLRTGSGTDRLQKLVAESGTVALAKSGWRVAGQPAAEGIANEPALPAKSNLPSAGVLDALRARWGEIQ
jgi:hypothetical protein